MDIYVNVYTKELVWSNHRIPTIKIRLTVVHQSLCGVADVLFDIQGYAICFIKKTRYFENIHDNKNV